MNRMDRLQTRLAEAKQMVAECQDIIKRQEEKASRGEIKRDEAFQCLIDSCQQVKTEADDLVAMWSELIAKEQAEKVDTSREVLRSKELSGC